LQNQGRSVAEDVYVKLVSVKKIVKNDENRGSIKLTPFNPFKLRWVSIDKVTELNFPWYGPSLKGVLSQKKIMGKLVKDEFEYVNMCTFVGAYYNTQNRLYFCPVLVPGLPNGDQKGIIVGEGQVAGMNAEILEIISNCRSEKNSTISRESIYEYDLVVGGSNFRTQHFRYTVICSICDKVPLSADIGKYEDFRDIDKIVKITICKNRKYKNETGCFKNVADNPPKSEKPTPQN
ncbi:MAG: hypothetical protein QXU18_16230, partial [Thermoplasmatales archaeon]